MVWDSRSFQVFDFVLNISIENDQSLFPTYPSNTQISESVIAVLQEYFGVYFGLSLAEVSKLGPFNSVTLL